MENDKERANLNEDTDENEKGALLERHNVDTECGPETLMSPYQCASETQGERFISSYNRLRQHNDSVEMSRGRYDLKTDDIALSPVNHEDTTVNLVPRYESRKLDWGSLKKSSKQFIETSRDKGEAAQLFRAAAGNKQEVLLFLLDSGVNPNVQEGPEGFTPLHLSVRSKSLDSTKILLSFGADPTIPSTNGTTPLHYACRHGDVDLCKLLLGDSVFIDVNVRDESGLTAFHLACVSGNAELFDLLIKRGADVFVRTYTGKNSLHIASSNGYPEIVNKLIKAAQNANIEYLQDFINSEDFENNTPLHMACKKGHLETVKVLLQHNADLDSRNDIVSNTPLHVAAQAGQVDIVKLLVDNGADVSTINELQRMPIHLAALFGNWKVTQCLLDSGSPIDPQDVTGLTPFLSAVSAGRFLVAERLIQLGADTSLRNESLQTCVDIAVQNKKMDMLKLLVDTIGTRILDVPDDKFMVPLHYCAIVGEFEMLKFILSKSANPHPRDIFDKTPLHMAAANGNIDCVKALAETNPLRINDADFNSSTPLHEAAKTGNQYVCKYLLHFGADVTSKDRNYWTPLHHAASLGYVRIVEILLKTKAINASRIINEQDRDDNTPLIIASKYGHVDVVHLLIGQGADITLSNHHRMTCLDEAVLHDKLLVVMEIIKNERWYEVVCHRPQDSKYPMKNLIEKMPQAAKAVFDRCIKFSNLPSTCKHRSFTIECDFRLLDSELSDSLVKGTLGNWSNDHETRNDDSEMGSVKHKYVEIGGEKRSSEFEVRFRSASGATDMKHNQSRYERSQKGSQKGTKETKRDKKERTERPSSYFYAPATMLRNKREALLSHPLVEIFLLDSWRRFGRHSFNISSLFYIVYLIVFAEFALTERTDEEDEKSIDYCGNKATCIKIYFTFIVSIIFLLKEFLQLATIGFEYFKHLNNYIEFLAYLATLVSTLPGLEKIQKDFPMITDACAFFLLFANVILLIRYLGLFGIYIMMFLEILKTMLKVLVIFVIFFVSFGLTLFILLKPEGTHMTHTFNRTCTNTFCTVFWTFPKVVFMTIDEIGYDDLVFPEDETIHVREFTTVILVIFGVLMNILLMNLLIGLAVGDIGTIQRNASFNKKAMTIEYILRTEQHHFHRWFAKIVGLKKRSTVVFKPYEIDNWIYAQFYSHEGVNIFLDTGANEKENTMVDQTKVLKEIIEKQMMNWMSTAKLWQSTVVSDIAEKEKDTEQDTHL